MSESQEGAKRGRGCGYGCMLLAGLFLGAGALVAVLLFGVLEAASSSPQRLATLLQRHHGGEAEAGEDEAPALSETWSMGHGDVKVVRVPLTGMIMLGGSALNLGNATTAQRAIRRATHDTEVRGLLLELNSSGGGITDSDILFKALEDFKAASPGRVVVTIMGDMACSGAYYVALASDHIVAHPTTLTGSIGVILQTYNVKELAAKVGVSSVAIKSGANKDLLNPFLEVPAEQRAFLQTIIDTMQGRFMRLVAEHRKLSKEAVAPLADGRIFIAEEALKQGLIDSVGYTEDAVAKTAELLQCEGVKVYRYDEELSFFDLLSSGGALGMDGAVGRLLRESVSAPRLMYRWAW